MPQTVARPAAGEYAPYFQRYLDRVPGEDALAVMVAQTEDTVRLLEPLSESRALHRYAEGKWSVKETLVHVMDAERVFAHRALRFARADRTELPGFDESAWVPACGADARPVRDLLAEFRAVRAATLALVRGLDEPALLRVGVANRHPMSVRGLVWCIAGHERHHVALLRERYGLGG